MPTPNSRTAEQHDAPKLYCDPEITARDETRNADLRQQAAFERARQVATPFARRREPILCEEFAAEEVA